MSAASYLRDWAEAKTRATEIRSAIRRTRCTEESGPERDDRGQVYFPGFPRCTEARPDTPADWCDPCQARSTARAELAMVTKQIRSVERKMLREMAR